MIWPYILTTRNRFRQGTNHAHEYPIVKSRNGLPHTTTHRSSPGNQALHSISAETGLADMAARTQFGAKDRRLTAGRGSTAIIGSTNT